MLRSILALLLFIVSLLTVLPIPAKQVWYLAIAVGEFPWVWIVTTTLLLIWVLKRSKRKLPSLALGLAALFLFSVPIVRAYGVAANLDEKLDAAFGTKKYALTAPHRGEAFTLGQMISGIGAGKIPFSTHQYALGGREHSLNFYPAQLPGIRPCLVVVHGGSWRSGTNAELPDVNSYYAKAGYQVATINYRLAPESKSPAPQEDVHAAFVWLRAHAAELKIDTSAFVLMGRSAGGQIVLTAAYSLKEPGLRGVVAFYGPADMLFAYNDKHKKLVMDHRMVMRDFLGGPPETARQAFIDASPVTYVNSATVPTLMVHGMLDEHVHFVESEILAKKLAAAGVPHMILGLPWATHGCEYSLNGPSGQLAIYAGERFMYAVTQGDLKTRGR